MTSTDRSPRSVPGAARRRPHPARRARRVVAALSAGSFLVLTGCFAVDGGTGPSAATTTSTDAGSTGGATATTSPTTSTTTTSSDDGWGTTAAVPGSGQGSTSSQSSGS